MNIPNYFKEWNPTEAQYMAVEESNRKRKVSCAKQLEEYRLKLEAERREKESKKSLLITKTKKK